MNTPQKPRPIRVAVDLSPEEAAALDREVGRRAVRNGRPCNRAEVLRDLLSRISEVQS